MASEPHDGPSETLRAFSAAVAAFVLVVHRCCCFSAKAEHHGGIDRHNEHGTEVCKNGTPKRSIATQGEANHDNLADQCKGDVLLDLADCITPKLDRQHQLHEV